MSPCRLRRPFEPPYHPSTIDDSLTLATRSVSIARKSWQQKRRKFRAFLDKSTACDPRPPGGPPHPTNNTRRIHEALSDSAENGLPPGRTSRLTLLQASPGIGIALTLMRCGGNDDRVGSAAPPSFTCRTSLRRISLWECHLHRCRLEAVSRINRMDDNGSAIHLPCANASTK